MAGPDFLSQLPSLDELLEHPKVAAAIERVNQSSAATRVRGAVTGLSAEISRRAEGLQGLTPGELLDRVVRRIDEPTRPPAGPLINATGRLGQGEWTQTPLPPAAIEAAEASSHGYVDGTPTAAVEAAKKLLDCEAAAVFSSPVAGLSAALEALAGAGVCLIARAEMSELAPGVRLDEVCRRAGVELREVGATDSTTLDDYHAALPTDGGAVVLTRRRDSAAAPSVGELTQLPGVTLLVDAGEARPLEHTPAYGRPADSVEKMLREGAALVLVDATGRLGGPMSALLVGREPEVGRVAGSLAGRSDQVAPMVDAALAATLELFASPDTLRFRHPLYELLDAPIESLRSRAERLAPQLASSESVVSAMAVEVPGPLASWGVRLVSLPGATSADLQARLCGLQPGVLTTVDDNTLLIDLRGVFAREDRALAAAFRPATPDPDDRGKAADAP